MLRLQYFLKKNIPVLTVDKVFPIMGEGNMGKIHCASDQYNDSCFVCLIYFSILPDFA